MSQSTLENVAVAVGGAALLLGAARYLVRRRHRIDLRGKVVLITGGSRGLGLLMARNVGRRGAKVAICARDADELQRADAELTGQGVKVMTVQCDLTRAEEVNDLVESVRQVLGPIDVLINNAAQIVVAPVQHQTEADFRTALDLTFWASYKLTELVLPDMRRRGGGRIVNVSSVGGLIPAPHLAAYVVAKHALIGYSRAMRNELARENILVTTVAPGLMRTGSPPHVVVRGNARAEYAWFKIADSLPLTSMSADRAARRIINAMIHGDADLTLTLSAKLGARVQSLFPNFSAFAGDMMNRALPAAVPAPAGDRTVMGRDAESPVTRSPLGALTDRAAVRNNAL